MAVGQELVVHPFSPVVDGHSRVLILGSLPSVKSRENHFYYGHPQNRFWKVLAGVCQAEVPVSVEEKKAFLLANGIAVWDVIASCRIVGSSDSSIRDVAANDVAGLLQDSRIEAVFCNGAKSWELYHRYCEKACQREAGKLPSTSPANAAWSPERLIKSWGEALLSYVGPGRKGLITMVTVRSMQIEDYDQVYALWMTIHGFSIRTIDDSREGVERFLKRNPGISVVAEMDGRVVGASLCGHDGRRGCLYHVCVHEDYRMHGIGRAMVVHCMNALQQEGINKVSLIAFTKNDIGNAFWKQIGWTKREDLNYYDFVLNQKNIENFNA